MTEKTERPRRRRRFGRIASRKWPSGRRTWRATWHCKVERRRVSRSFDTEKEARDFLAELERQVLTRNYAVPPTLREAEEEDAEILRAAQPREAPELVAYAREIIERRFEPMLAKGTLGVYRAALRAWTEFFGARGGQRALRLDALTPSLWLDYRAWRAGSRNSSHGSKRAVGNRTLNADQQCMVRLLNEAVTDGHLDQNPLAGMKKLREQRRTRRYLTKEEIARLLDACPRDFRPLAIAMAYTGARKSELTALRWCDIDFEHGKIALVRSKVGNVDLLDLHPVLRTALLRLRLRRKEPTPREHVFLSRKGVPFTNVTKSWAIALRGAGLEGRDGLTPHSLRHSFAVHFLEGGGAVTDLQQQLGHADLATTQIYAAGLSERRRATVMGLEFGVRPRGARSAAERAG